MLKSLYSFVRNILSPIHISLNWVNVLQILSIAILIFFVYKKFIQNTQSEKFIKGLFILFLAWILSEVLILINLQIFGVFLKMLVSLVALSLIVIFQPELRRFLGYLGQPGFITKTFFSCGTRKQQSIQDVDVVKELIEAVKYLTKTKTGALIVLKKSLSSLVYSEVGTVLNARISTELILTIFHPNTPLHDGAMIVEGNKILSAGVLLPLTEDPQLSWKYGTRHRAALGMSEVSDAACLVVSEETGDVSICMDGMLKKYEDLVTLKNDLNSILGIKQPDAENNNKNFFDKLKGA
ncbi:MAG: diadenylate cyclase CdaA [bacterium]|nr:diadenylate cyclase CdaA [bacterium]